MNQILPHLLWLGHAGDGRAFRKLFDADIKAVVELAAEEPSSPVPRELFYCRIPLLDGLDNNPDWLFLALTTVASLLRRRVPTLVCCGAGRSRSPAIAAAALALAHDLTPEECLQRVAERHPSDVSPGLWKEITAFLSSIRTAH
jgi:protein-tyrosine phosphatase